MAKANRKKGYDLNDAFTDVYGNVYDKEAANGLTMWLRMVSGSVGPIDKGPHGLTANAENTPVYREAIIGRKTVPYMSASDSNGTKLYVSSSGFLDFSSLPDTGVPSDGTDRPFTVSCWLNLDQATGEPHGIFGKNCGTLAGPLITYDIHVDALGSVQFQIGEGVGGTASRGVKTPNSAITANQWYHVACTYDGRGGTNAQNGMYIHVNAVSQSCSTIAATGSYNGMQPVYIYPTFIGARYNDADEFDGKIAEFAVWKHKLSTGEISAVYNATREGSFQLISGFLNNPPRTRLVELDSRLGSYPTVARTGDPDFTGKTPVFFDDTNTVNFYGSFATAKITFLDVPRPRQKIRLGHGHMDFGGSNLPFMNQQLIYMFAYGPTIQAAGALRKASENKTNIRQIVNIKEAADLKKEALGDGADAPVSVYGTKIEQTSNAPLAALESVAAAFAAAVNAARDNTIEGQNHGRHRRASRMQARADGATVLLRMEQPMRGAYDQPKNGSTSTKNIIQTESHVYWRYNANNNLQQTQRVDVLIEQFKQVGPNVYRYPFMLPLTSSHATNRIASPNIISNITGAARMMKGVSDVDAYITPNTYESISPFNESRTYLDNDSAFNSIGTPISVAPGFDQRLSSKISLTFPINTTRTDKVFFSTGNLPYTSPNFTKYANYAAGYNANVRSGLAYYNWNDKRWEDPADLSSGSNVDYFSAFDKISTGSMLAIVPSPLIGVGQSDLRWNEFNPLLGLPSNYANFPYDRKFDATGSQLLSLTGAITAPFLLEKIRVEFSGALGLYTYDAHPNVAQMQSSTFMLLLQRDTKLSVTGTNTYEAIDTSTDPDTLYELTSNTFIEKEKDIIWYGRMGVYFKSNTHSMGFDDLLDFQVLKPGSFAACEKWIPKTGSYANRFEGVTGSFEVEGSPRTVGAIKRATINAKQRGDVQPNKFIGISHGGRSLRAMADGRSYVGGVAGLEVSGAVSQTILQITGEGDDGRDVFLTYNDPTKISPYVLMPNDKLILAIANQPMPHNTTYSTEVENRHRQIELAPGDATLTLYGTHLREDKAVEGSTNQPLTSVSIHEDVRDDVSPLGESRCLDQWVVEPRNSYRGSYIDYVLTGTATPHDIDDVGVFGITFDNGVTADPFFPDVRQVVAYSTEGNITPSGSLTRHAGTQERSRYWGPISSIQRFVRLSSPNEVYYDSTVPRLDKYVSASNMTLFNHPAYGTFIFLYNHLEKAVLQKYETEDTQTFGVIGKGPAKFLRSFPFEAKFLEFAKTRVRTPEEVLATENHPLGNNLTTLCDRIMFFTTASSASQFWIANYLGKPYPDPNAAKHAGMIAPLSLCGAPYASEGLVRVWRWSHRS